MRLILTLAAWWILKIDGPALQDDLFALLERHGGQTADCVLYEDGSGWCDGVVLTAFDG